VYLIASIGANITDISTSSLPRNIPLYCDSATIEAESAGRLSTYRKGNLEPFFNFNLLVDVNPTQVGERKKEPMFP
jgi:hypothetical protein